MRSTNTTHGYQGKPERLHWFYSKWAPFYNFSVKLDPAFKRNLKLMVENTVHEGDSVLDIGCGTGISTLLAAGHAQKVTGIDMSQSMLKQLQQQISKASINNIEIIEGVFPGDIPDNASYDSIISSFAFVHWPKQQLGDVYNNVFKLLNRGGHVGLFLARGEVAGSFETREEISSNLQNSGFQNIEIIDVDDVYRIATAQKP